MEQTARGLNAICRRWLARRRATPDLAHTAAVIRYHQARNKAAKDSRLRAAEEVT